MIVDKKFAKVLDNLRMKVDLIETHEELMSVWDVVHHIMKMKQTLIETKAGMDFGVGDQVEFTSTKRGRLKWTGKITHTSNRKAHVLCRNPFGEERTWIVSYSMLKRIEKPKKGRREET